ncbi:MAG TPA: hypothetical protein VGW40_10530 [Allosphingosinicella sp.]|nr:hypothetical protein [Allosphingosinicella sp.]
MRQYLRPKLLLNPTIVATAFLTQNLFQRKFEAAGIGGLYLIAPITLSVAGMVLADYLYDSVLEASRRLRRVLAGEHYIEGDWANVVICLDKPDTVESVEYCRIRYLDGQFCLTGDTYSTDGTWIGNFHSEGSMYNDRSRELEYFYKVGIGRTGGYALIQFSPLDSAPTQFICRYFDESCVAPYLTVGKRVSKRFMGYDTERRGSIAVAACSELKPFAISEIRKIQSVKDAAAKRTSLDADHDV